MTGLIYVAIIALWAAVLVPMWLKRHDHASESRTVERFDSAMRSLSGSKRRSRRPGEREVLQPRRESQREVVVTGARGRVGDRQRLSASEARAARGLDRQDRPVRTAAARRRRTVLLLLLLTTVATAALALLGLVPVATLVVPAGSLVLFAVLAARGSARRPQAERPARPQPRRSDRESERLRPRRGSRTIESAPGSVLAATGTDGLDPDAWEPVPTTLPTYVNAPRASGIPRILDLTTPGSWTSAAMLERAQQMRSHDLHAEQEAALADDRDDLLVDYVDPGAPVRRRAVNG